jgi:PAS domain S-box-containing protein
MRHAYSNPERKTIARRSCTANQSPIDGSLAMLAAIIDSSDDAIISRTLTGIISSWNKGAERMFGYTAEEAIGQPATILSPPDCVTEESEILARISRGERVEHFETVRVRKDGANIDVSVTISPIVDSDGTIVGASKIARDITQRKRAERIQRDYSKILDFAQFLVRDMQGRIVQWSLGAERLYGYTRAEAVGHPFHELLRTTFPEPLEVINGRLLSTNSWEGELTHHKRDGTEIIVASVWVLQRDAKGDPLRVLEANTDVTDRMADQKLAAQVFRLELFNKITRAVDGRQDLTSIFQVVIRRLEEHLAIDFGCVCLYDPQEKRLAVAAIGTCSQDLANNIALTASSGDVIAPDGLTRSLHGEVAYEPDLAGVNAPFLRRLASGGIRALVTAPLRVESEVFGILITGRREPQSFSGGDCEFLAQLSEHVALATHQARLQSALLTAYETLRDTQEAVIQQERMRVLGQMASGIAHDINNALSPAALYADMLLTHDGNLSPESREYLGVIQRAIEDVAASVARMRQFYRQPEPNSARALVDLNRTIEQVVDLTRAQWNTMPQEKGFVVRMETVLAPDLPLILGSEAEIRDAFANLILNAVDAMPTGGSVSVRSRALTPNKVCIEVADTGIGMDEATRSRCLEPFFTTKNARGSGLGLAMVYGMLERHDGEIEIASELGRGAVMRLTFPTPDIKTTRGAAIVVPLAPTRPLRILLVDDDPILLKSLRLTLERDGHIVVAADGGQTGIAAFHKSNATGRPFDIVITDLGMPYVDGRAVAAAVKLSKHDIPVILLTGWGRRMIEENDTPPHVNCILSKPPKTAQLRSALAEFTHKGGFGSLAVSLG